MACLTPDIQQWRTPNEWVFVAVCQKCGIAATSFNDDAEPLRVVSERHQALIAKHVALTLQDVDLWPLEEEHGDHMTLAEFEAACNNGSFIDYDGTGRYATATHEARDLYANPSDFKAGNINRNFTHVMWYNR